MQYALMVYAEPGYEEAFTHAEREEALAEFAALADDPRCGTAAQLTACALLRRREKNATARSSLRRSKR